MAAGNDSGSRKGKGVSGNHGASSECSHSGGGSGIQEHHRRPPQEQKESTPFGESICMARIPGKVVPNSRMRASARAGSIEVPLENDFYPNTGIDKEDSYVLEMKPVVPFKLSNDWNLITRTVIPVAQVPDLAPGVNGASGLGDVQTSLFFSPVIVGKVIWGAGPVISLPTATEGILGTKKVRCKSNADAALRELQHAAWVVPNVVAHNYLELGSK